VKPSPRGSSRRWPHGAAPPVKSSSPRACGAPLGGRAPRGPISSRRRFYLKIKKIKTSPGHPRRRPPLHPPPPPLPPPSTTAAVPATTQHHRRRPCHQHRHHHHNKHRHPLVPGHHHHTPPPPHITTVWIHRRRSRGRRYRPPLRTYIQTNIHIHTPTAHHHRRVIDAARAESLMPHRRDVEAPGHRIYRHRPSPRRCSSPRGEGRAEGGGGGRRGCAGGRDEGGAGRRIWMGEGVMADPVAGGSGWGGRGRRRRERGRRGD
jgi:hypothetical protein